MHNLTFGSFKFWGVVVLVTSSLIYGVLQLDAGSSSSVERMDKLNDGLIEKCQSLFFENGCVDLYIQFWNIDPETQYVDGLLFIEVPEKYGTNLNSSVQVNYPTDIYLDAATIDTGDLNQNLFYETFDYIRSIKYSLDLTNRVDVFKANDKYYPFDKYSTDLSGSIAFLENEGSDKDVSLRTRLPIIAHDYTAVVPGWKIQLDYEYPEEPNFEAKALERQESGYFGNVLLIERSDLTKIIVIIFAFIFVGGAISLLILLHSLLARHKKPSITGLVWAGSTTFTLIQTRSLLPGNPRSGILFDLVIFYPSLVACFICSIFILILWVKSDEGKVLVED